MGPLLQPNDDYVFGYSKTSKGTRRDRHEWEKFLWHYEGLRLDPMCATKHYFGDPLVDHLFPLAVMTHRTQGVLLFFTQLVHSKVLTEARAKVPNNKWKDREGNEFEWRATQHRADITLNGSQARFGDVFVPLVDWMISYIKWTLDGPVVLKWEQKLLEVADGVHVSSRMLFASWSSIIHVNEISKTSIEQHNKQSFTDLLYFQNESVVVRQMYVN